MNCYNGEQYLHESLNSIINQKYSNWELIFWNNQSNDQTEKIVKSYKDKRIKYFLSNEHTNLGMARKLALNYVTGQYIAFLDADDIWLEDKLITQVNFIKKNHEANIIVTNALFFNKQATKKAYNKKKPKSGNNFRNYLTNHFIIWPTVMINLETIKKENLTFDENLELNSDFDLLIRLLKKNKLYYIDEVLSKYRVHDSNLTNTRPMKHCNEVEYVIKKMEKNINHFKDTYSKEIKIIKRENEKNKAIIYWSYGYKFFALKKLLKFAFSNTKYTLLIILMFFSYKFYLKIQRMRALKP